MLREELRSIRERDPAARSNAQIFALYSGFHALVYYRVAHWFQLRGRYGVARWISQRARHKTGIEIHPGATIGKGLFIDHGMGVVIGETAEIGDNVTIYQGVTLGGTGKDTGKRHPTIGDGVVIGAGAKVLGPFKVGSGAKIAAGAVVLDEVPPNATAVGVPARIVRINGQKVESLDQIHIPDPVSQELCRMQIQIDHLKSIIAELESRLPPDRLPEKTEDIT